jgi:hypothetical protein
MAMNGEREAVEARARVHWPKWCEKFGWEVTPPPETRIVFAADFSLAENAELRKERDEALGLAGATMEELEAAEAEVAKLSRVLKAIAYKYVGSPAAKEAWAALNPGAAKEGL